MINSLRFLLFTALFFTLTACGSSSSPNVNPETVAGKIANNPDLSTLTKALQDADLFELLDDTRATYTIFAPSNAAFITFGTLPQGDDLTRLLYYHVVNDAFDEAQLRNAPLELETVESSTIAVTVVDGKITLNGRATIIQSNITGSNGVIHMIDTVLSPAN